jgi:methyltransferase
MPVVLLFGAVVGATLGIEAILSARHERLLRARGAIEPAADVYRAMQIAYPGAFLAMLIEGAWRAVQADALVTSGVAVFLLAKTLKYWAIASLGERWTFRVLVPPESDRTISGPYRWFPHPNYVAVALELTGTAIVMHALISGPLAIAGFCYLMVKRVQIEEKALAGR